MYLSWKTSTTHYPYRISPAWMETNFKYYWEAKDFTIPDGFNAKYYNSKNLNVWLNCLRWTDDAVKEIILGFRERGLEDETLFVMYLLLFRFI